MKRTLLMLGVTLAAGIAIGAVGAQLLAQQPGVKRAMLLKTELTGIDGKEAFLGHAEVSPGASAGKHYHHGHEFGYVLEGSGVIEVEGAPSISVKAGDAYHIEPGRPHDARNTGTTPLKAVAVWIVEKGKPLAVPVQ